MWSTLGTSWAHVDPTLAYVRPMLGLCWPISLGWAYVGVCWPHMLVRQFKSSGGPLPVRPARITDTTLEKHSVLAFLHLCRVALRYAQ